MPGKEKKNFFIDGPVLPSFIAASIETHQAKRNIGGHSIFLGQVRADKINDKIISAIEYSANEIMALEKLHLIREELFSKYELTCMHVHHSLGTINAGEICFFVFTSSTHRKAAIEACNEAVEKIKSLLPIWGREIFNDESHQWKVNI